LGTTKNKPLVEGVDEGNKMDLLWELMKEIKWIYYGS
jgi:hypothetical protein